jgi:hypothetical protein
MPRVAVHHAALHVSSRVADIVVVGIVNANPARCTQQFVLTVAMKHKYLFSRERIDLCIAAIVTSRKARVAIVAADRAGNLHEPDQREPR